MAVKKTDNAAKSAASGNNRSGVGAAKKPGQPPPKGSTRLTPEDLAKIHQALLGAAKTPDQHADAAVVRAAAEEAQKGNQSTAHSLLARVGAWAQEVAPILAQHIEIAVAREIQRIL